MKERYHQFLVFLYQIMSKQFLFRRYIQNIRHIYEMVKPTDEITIIIDTMRLVLKSGSITFLLLFYSLSLKGSSIYYDLIIISFIFIFQNQCIRSTITKEERKLLKQFEKYIGNVRHFYHSTGMVEEAIYDSLEEAEYEISLHIAIIYDILISQKKEELERYKEIAPNKFLMTFLALCQITISYGDSKREGLSLFLSNLNDLKKEVNVEILKLERIRALFSGLIFVTIVPIFFLKAIEHWGISNLPELERYYTGTYGIVITVMIFLTTVICYQIISHLKESNLFFRKHHKLLEKISQLSFVEFYINYYLYQHPKRAKQLHELFQFVSEGMTVPFYLIQKALIFIGTFCCLCILSIHISITAKQQCFSNFNSLDAKMITSQTKKIEQYKQIVIELGKELKNERKDSNKRKNLKHYIKKQYQLTKEEDLNLIYEEVISRINAYQQIHYKWYYTFFLLIIAKIISYIPLITTKIKKSFLYMNREDEVMQFHSIILMLIYIKRVNVEIILEWLEQFAEIFKPSLMECVDQFSYDEELALIRLKEQEPFLPFVRIIENLEACDKVGVEQAFDEIASQKSFFAEKRKQENEITISNKAVIGKVIAYIPLVLILSFYLIIPFVLESVSQLLTYVNQMSGI